MVTSNRTQIDSPWRKGDLNRPPKPRDNSRPKHDQLCPDYIDAKGSHLDLGLAYCWCMCGKCWQDTGSTRQGKPTGRCIHPGCLCRRSP